MNEERNTKLSLTQQFEVQALKSQLKNMDAEQVLEYACYLVDQLYYQKQATKQLLAHKWGIPTNEPIGLDGMNSYPINENGEGI